MWDGGWLQRYQIQLCYSRVVNPSNLPVRVARRTLSTLALIMLLLTCSTQPAASATEPDSPPAAAFTADGRSTLEQLSRRYESLSTEPGWQMDTVYQYPGADAPAIRAWRTAHRGEALWILAGSTAKNRPAPMQLQSASPPSSSWRHPACRSS